jgi:hypothetical protein
MVVTVGYYISAGEYHIIFNGSLVNNCIIYNNQY